MRTHTESPKTRALMASQERALNPSSLSSTLAFQIWHIKLLLNNHIIFLYNSKVGYVNKICYK